MFRILGRSIAGEIALSFLFTLSFLTFLTVISQVLKFLDKLILVGADIPIFLNFLIFAIPSVLSITIPISYLVAALVTAGRMKTDSEIVPILSSGIAPSVILRPVLSGALVISILTFLAIAIGEPSGRYGMKRVIMNAGRERIHAIVEERSFNNALFNMAVYVDEIGEDGKYLEGIMISDSREKRADVIIFARRGEVLLGEETPLLLLEDGSIHIEREGEGYYLVGFDSYYMDLSYRSKLFEKGKSLQEQFPWEILDWIRREEGKGGGAWNGWVEFHKKFSYPFAAFAFALLGFPAGLAGKKMSRTRGYLMSGLIVLVYYIFLRIAEVYGGRGVIPPLFSLWLPNILFTGGGYLFFRRVMRY